MTSRATTLSFTDACAALSLARWELRLAVRLGLLARRPSGRLERASVEAAAADPRFRERLEAEELLVARQAAALLGVPATRFREAAVAGVFTPAAVEAWRYGRVPLYRAADVRAAEAAYRDWEAHRVPTRDPAASRARIAQRRASAVAMAGAQSKLESELATLASWDQAEAPLVAASYWLGRLSTLCEAFGFSASYANVRSRRQFYADRATAAQSLVYRCWEIIAASGHPALTLARRPASFFLLCPTCAAAEPQSARADPGDWDFAPTYSGQPGCPACRVSMASLYVTVRFSLAVRTLSFHVMLSRSNAEGTRSAAGCWTALGDDTLVRHPFAEVRRYAGADRSLPGMDPATFRSLDPDLRAALFAELDEAIAEMRAAGAAPTALVPAWYAALPIDDDPNQPAYEGAPVGAWRYDRYDRQVTPLERVVEELRAVLGGFPHGFLFHQAIAELPGLRLV